jgi:hypothetical protein
MDGNDCWSCMLSESEGLEGKSSRPLSKQQTIDNSPGGEGSSEMEPGQENQVGHRVTTLERREKTWLRNW